MPDSPTRSAVLRMPHCNLRPKAGKKSGRGEKISRETFGDRRESVPISAGGFLL